MCLLPRSSSASAVIRYVFPVLWITLCKNGSVVQGTQFDGTGPGAESGICDCFIGPILWGHGGPLCHALSLLLLSSSSSSLLWTSMRRRRATVATPGEWQCGVQRLAVANGPNIFQMLLVQKSSLVPGPSAAPTTSTVFYCITALQPQTSCPLSTVT